MPLQMNPGPSPGEEGVEPVGTSLIVNTAWSSGGVKGAISGLLGLTMGAKAGEE